MKTVQILLIPLFVMLLLGCSQSDGSSAASEDSLNTVELAPSNWYIRLVAEDSARGLKTESSQLGELDEDNATHKSALRSIGTTGENYIDLMFENPVGLQEGLYKSIFYTHDDTVEKRWRFKVTTDDVNADMTLTWHGMFVLTASELDATRMLEHRTVTNPLIRQMKLVDTKTSKEVQAIRDGRIMKYTFNMDGSTTRDFEWVVATSEVNIELPPVVEKDTITTSSQKSSSRSSDIETYEEEPQPKAEPKQRTFDFKNPPMPKF